MDLNNPQDNWEECIQNYAREIVNPDLKLDISRIYTTIRDSEEYFPDKEIDQYFRWLLDSLNGHKKARKCFKSIFGNHSFRYMDSKSLNPIAKADAFKMDLCILFRAFPRWFARASLFLLQNGSTIRVVLKALTVNSSDELNYDASVRDLDFALPTKSEQETVMAIYPEVVSNIELPRPSRVKRPLVGGQTPPPKKQAVASEQPAVSSSSSSVPVSAVPRAVQGPRAAEVEAPVGLDRSEPSGVVPGNDRGGACITASVHGNTEGSGITDSPASGRDLSAESRLKKYDGPVNLHPVAQQIHDSWNTDVVNYAPPGIPSTVWKQKVREPNNFRTQNIQQEIHRLQGELDEMFGQDTPADEVDAKIKEIEALAAKITSKDRALQVFSSSTS
eukprot:123875_1